MSDEVKEGLTDTSDEVKQKQEIEEEHDEERGEEHDGASRNKTAARQRTKLATTHQLLWQRIPILLRLSCYDLMGLSRYANPILGGLEFTAIVAEILKNAWKKHKIKLETTKTQRNQRRQRTDQHPRRRTDQRHTRLISFSPTGGLVPLPTPTLSVDGCNGCAAMT